MQIFRNCAEFQSENTAGQNMSGDVCSWLFLPVDIQHQCPCRFLDPWEIPGTSSVVTAVQIFRLLINLADFEVETRIHTTKCSTFSYQEPGEDNNIYEIYWDAPTTAYSSSKYLVRSRCSFVFVQHNTKSVFAQHDASQIRLLQVLPRSRLITTNYY